MLDAQIEALIRRVRGALQSGHAIAVMGWRNNCHTPFTKGLPERKVRFYNNDKPPKSLGPTIGLALCADYLNHTDKRRVMDDRMCPHKMHYHTIINVLESCRDLLDA